MAPFTIKAPKTLAPSDATPKTLAPAPSAAKPKPAVADPGEVATPSKSKPKEKSAKIIDGENKERKEKRKAKKLEAKVNAEKEGSGSEAEQDDDFEDGPTAKPEKPKASKQQKKADEGPPTRIDFEALGEDHMELKQEVQNLKQIVIDLQTTALKSMALIYRIQDGEAPAAAKMSKMEVEAPPAAKKGAKPDKKEKKEKGPPSAYLLFTAAARPKMIKLASPLSWCGAVARTTPPRLIETFITTTAAMCAPPSSLQFEWDRGPLAHEEAQPPGVQGYLAHKKTPPTRTLQ